MKFFLRIMDSIVQKKYMEVEIERVGLGDYIINLGEILEIDDLSEFFSVVISRAKRKRLLNSKKVQFW